MPTIPRSDIAAALLIAVLLAIQLPFVALGNRSAACLSLLAIGGVVLLLSRALRPDATGWLTAVFAVVSATTGVLAIPLPSGLLSTISVGAIVAMWSVNLAERLRGVRPSCSSSLWLRSRRS